MLSNMARRTATAAFTRQLATKAGNVSFVGTRPNVMQKEQLRQKFFNFREKPEIIPLVFVVTLACSMGVTKLLLSDARAPETTFDPSVRSNIEKRLIDRDVERNERWEQNAWHVGPFSRGREILGIKPSDPKLDYKQ